MTTDMAEKNRNLLDSVDARTRLAGSNKMEILLFSLGTRETFGINVFKVREVGRAPHITKTAANARSKAFFLTLPTPFVNRKKSRNIRNAAKTGYNYT